MGMKNIAAAGARDTSKLKLNLILGCIGLIFTPLFFPLGILISIAGLTICYDKEVWQQGAPINLFNLILGIIIALLAFRII